MSSDLTTQPQTSDADGVYGAADESHPLVAGTHEGSGETSRPSPDADPGHAEDGADLSHDPGEGLTLADLDAIARRTVRAAQSRIAEVEMTRERQHAEVQAEADREHGKIDATAEQLLSADWRIVADFTAQCEAFMRRRLAGLQKGDKKSVMGIYVSIESREQPPEYVRDEAVLLEWAGPAAFTRRPEPPAPVTDWAKIKKYCRVEGDRMIDENDRPVPGVEVVERPPTIKVTVVPQ